MIQAVYSNTRIFKNAVKIPLFWRHAEMPGLHESQLIEKMIDRINI